jgi:L-lactate dehydrogenase complex protein LldG
LEEPPVSERDLILGRIREALRAKAPSHSPSPAPVAANLAGNGAGARHWLPPVGATFEERLDLFRRNSVDLKAAFHFVPSEAAAHQVLRDLCAAEGWKSVAAHQGALTSKACAQLPVPVMFVDDGYDRGKLEQCDAGITECDALVAQTGSVLLTSRSAGGRALSVLPPHHVVVSRKEQLIADLPEAFALLERTRKHDYPSFISFVSGPSRTGDIERILVLGAHGPKQLTIICF